MNNPGSVFRRGRFFVLAEFVADKSRFEEIGAANANVIYRQFSRPILPWFLNSRKAGPMYRNFLLASVGAIALAGPAWAAELPPPPPPPIFTWTGVYVGGQIGAAWGAGNYTFTGFNPATGAVLDSSIGGTPSGAIGGAHVGYQIQIDQWVFGLEGSVDGTTLSKTVSIFSPGFLRSGLITSASAETTEPVDGSIRGRFGIAFDRVLIYATGGVAFGGFNTQLTLVNPTVPPLFVADSFSTTRVGWTAGGGLEYALFNNWWVFGEYRFTDFGTVTNGLVSSSLPAGVFFNENRRLQQNQVQIGMSYRFEFAPPVPVVAKY
jgi:outer membrane immunogenic protein